MPGGRDERGSRNTGPQRRAAGPRDYDDRDYEGARDYDSADDLLSGKSGRGSQRFDDPEERTIRTRSRSNQDRSQAAGREETAAGRERGNTGPHARPDSRKSTSTSRREDSLPEVKPRPSRSKRDDDGEWPSTEWDELSDVDYWAELASDKPITPAQPVTPPVRAEREPRSESDPGSRRSERREAADRKDATERRDSGERRDSREGSERRDTTERRESGTERREQPLLPAARSSRPGTGATFTPAVSPASEAGFGGRGDGYGSTELRRSIAAGGDPLRSLPAVPSVPAAANRPTDDDPLTSPSFPRITDDSRSYRRGRADSPSGTPFRADDSSYHPVPPVVPLPTADSQVTAAYSRPAHGDAGYAAAPLEHYSLPGTPASDSHLTSAPSASYTPPAPAGGYLPAGGLGYHTESGTGSYSASLPAPYPPEPPGTAPYATHEPVGYSYSTGQDPGGYAAPAYSPASLPGYPDYAAGSAAGQTQAGHEQGNGYSYGHQPSAGYPDYHQPDPADSTAAYPAHEGLSADLRPEAPVAYPPTQYTSQYEPAGYAAGGYEPEGGYPADPYAVDPYGYPGYGAARLSEEYPADQPRLSENERAEPSWQAQQWDDQLSRARFWPLDRDYAAPWGETADEQDRGDRSWEDED